MHYGTVSWPITEGGKFNGSAENHNFVLPFEQRRCSWRRIKQYRKSKKHQFQAAMSQPADAARCAEDFAHQACVSGWKRFVLNVNPHCFHRFLSDVGTFWISHLSTTYQLPPLEWIALNEFIPCWCVTGVVNSHVVQLFYFIIGSFDDDYLKLTAVKPE